MVSATEKNVFLSYSLPDGHDAEIVRNALENAGIVVFDPIRDAEPGSGLERSLHDAIAGSGAIVLVAPKDWKISANSLFELGAAWGAEKDIYVVADETVKMGSKVPEFIGQQQIYPQSRLNDLARRLTVRPEPYQEKH